MSLCVSRGVDTLRSEGGRPDALAEILLSLQSDMGRRFDMLQLQLDTITKRLNHHGGDDSGDSGEMHHKKMVACWGTLARGLMVFSQDSEVHVPMESASVESPARPKSPSVLSGLPACDCDGRSGSEVSPEQNGSEVALIVMDDNADCIAPEEFSGHVQGRSCGKVSSSHGSNDMDGIIVEFDSQPVLDSPTSCSNHSSDSEATHVPEWQKHYFGEKKSTLCPAQTEFQKKWGGRLQKVTIVLILLNAGFMGVQAELSVRSLQDNTPMPASVVAIDTAFTVAFCTELLLRLAIDQLRFFFGSDFAWNAFDSLLVLSAVLDFLLSTFNFSFARVIRVLRVMRALRVIRIVKFAHVLRLMIASILASMVSIFWAFVLLAFVIYLCSLFVVQSLEMFVTPTTADYPAHLFDLYGSLPMTFFSLFSAITNGTDWNILLQPLAELSTLYRVVFMIYIMFVVLGIMNILTAVFVENISNLARVDQNLVIEKELDNTTTVIKEMADFFRAADTDSNGYISFAELDAHLKNAEAFMYLKTRGVHVTDATDLWKLLDPNGSDMVTGEVFVRVMMPLMGDSQAMDVQTMLHEHRKEMLSVHNQLNRIAQRLDGSNSAVQEPVQAEDGLQKSTSRELESKPKKQVRVVRSNSFNEELMRKSLGEPKTKNSWNPMVVSAIRQSGSMSFSRKKTSSVSDESAKTITIAV